MFRANLAYLRVPRRKAVVKAEIEERSFVANYAPLDDGQVRFGGGTGRLGEADRLNLTLRKGGEEGGTRHSLHFESHILGQLSVLPRFANVARNRRAPTNVQRGKIVIRKGGNVFLLDVHRADS